MTRIVAGRPAQKYDERNESAFRREAELASLRTDQRLQSIDRSVAPLIPVSAFGAVGDGVADDTAALQAALTVAGPIKGELVFPPNATYKISETIRGRNELRWQFNETTFRAAVDGTYDDVLDQSGTPTGLKVFFAVDSGRRSLYHGRLVLDGNGVANLCGISGNAASSHELQRWESIQINNFERGIYALDQNNGNTIVGHHFGTVEFFLNGYDLYFEGNGADDAVFDIVRSQSATQVTHANKHNILLVNGARGATIHSLYLHGQRADRDGLRIVDGSSLVCGHLYVEHDFASPIAIGDNSNLIVFDLKVSAVISSTNGNIITVFAGADTCVIDVTFNSRVLGSGGISHLLRVLTDDSSTYGRTVIMRLPFPVTSKTPVIYSGVGASDADNIVVYAEGGFYRYTYDGVTTAERLYPLVIGGTVAATGPVGNVVAKSEVFDAQGQLKGFMPIYDTIT